MSVGPRDASVSNLPGGRLIEVLNRSSIVLVDFLCVRLRWGRAIRGSIGARRARFVDGGGGPPAMGVTVRWIVVLSAGGGHTGD